VPGASANILSRRQLGVALGVSHQAAATWVRHAEWPFGTGPWDRATLPRMKAWAARTLSPDPGAVLRSETAGGEESSKRGMSDYTKASVLKKIEDAKTARVKRQILEGQYHLTSECRARLKAVVIASRDALLDLADRLPAATDEQRTWLAAEIDRVLRGFGTS